MLVVFSRLLWEISGSKAFSVSRDFSSSVVFLLRIGSGLFLKDSSLSCWDLCWDAFVQRSFDSLIVS